MRSIHKEMGLFFFNCGSLMHAIGIQKVLFLDTAYGVATTLRPYWSEATGDRANVVQAQADMLEIVPPRTSKGSGVKLLLDHLGVSPNEVLIKKIETKKEIAFLLMSVL